jgi:hypothetical protein
MKVSRSVVYARVGKCKTEVSRQPVPLDGLTAEELSKWHEACTYGQPSDWIFASEWVGGKMPPWANTLLTRFIRPAAKEAKITNLLAGTPSATPIPPSSREMGRM